MLLLAAYLTGHPDPFTQRLVVRTPTCSLPVAVVEDSDSGKATAVILHGFSANAGIMKILGRWMAENPALRVSLVDLPGHGDNVEPFRFARAEQCAQELLETLAQQGRISADRTALVGHSMGGGIAVRMADRLPTVATIAISPAPGPLPRRMPSNLLVFSAEFDPSRLERASQELADAAQGERTRSDDFAQRRAFRLQEVRWATHTSLIWDTRVAAAANQWVASALGNASRGARPRSQILAGNLLGVLGLLMMFPVAARAAGFLAARSRARPAGEIASLRRSLVGWVAVSMLAIIALRWWLPLEWLRIYDGDYLASFLFVAGVLLLAVMWDGARRQERARHGVPLPRDVAAGGVGARSGAPVEGAMRLRWDWRGAAMGAVVGLVTVLAFGAWLNWQLYDLWLNAPRWWRFAVMLPFLVPYFFAEELALGTPLFGWRARTRRYLQFFALRGILFSALLVAIYFLGNGPFLAVLLAAYLVLFSLLQRLGADVVHRRSGSPAAGAVFSAILAAWFMAGVMPIT